jgi:hypothetical protein
LGFKQYFKSKLFQSINAADFETLALELFHHQAEHNRVYNQYLQHLCVEQQQITALAEVPFMPLRFFKTFDVQTGSFIPEVVFTSSATTGMGQSKHGLAELNHYTQTYTRIFEQFFGDPREWCILALLPSYLEREGSSLIEMCKGLIHLSKDPDSGFYLHNLADLHRCLQQKEARGVKTLLIGVSFALLDFAEQYPTSLTHTHIMETGGMKGRRKELLRETLHAALKQAFGLKHIYSEYGMTELLSQAYSLEEGRFKTPWWMQVYIRQTDDPFKHAPHGKTGGINIVDLANVDSCAFLETMDLGRLYKDGTFEVLGRFDHVEVRGCNLMVQ